MCSSSIIHVTSLLFIAVELPLPSIIIHNSPDPDSQTVGNISGTSGWKIGQVPVIIVTPPSSSSLDESSAIEITLPSCREDSKFLLPTAACPSPAASDIGVAYNVYQKVVALLFSHKKLSIRIIPCTVCVFAATSSVASAAMHVHSIIIYNHIAHCMHACSEAFLACMACSYIALRFSAFLSIFMCYVSQAVRCLGRTQNSGL